MEVGDSAAGLGDDHPAGSVVPDPLAMVRPDHGDVGTKLQIKLLGDLYDATIIEESPFDPENERLRA